VVCQSDTGALGLQRCHRLEYEAHCDEHDAIQAALDRKEHRTYGARYISNKGAKSSSAPKAGLRTQSETGQGSHAIAGPVSNHPNMSTNVGQGRTTHRIEISSGVRSTNKDQKTTKAFEKPLADLLQLFPAVDQDGTTDPEANIVDINCSECTASFASLWVLKKASSVKMFLTIFGSHERLEHHLSNHCPGSAIKVYLLYIDRSVSKVYLNVVRCVLTTLLFRSNPSGYRIENKIIPFDARSSQLKCPKCDEYFGSEEEKESHEAGRKSRCQIRLEELF
jgi:hypothetical protein